jgi:flavin-dependent dehydrogenase
MQRVYAGALLVGDAGAFVNPLTGAGIYNALETGRIAAEVALEAIQRNDWSLDELRKFEVRWRSVLGKGLMVGTILKPLLIWPGALDLLIRQMHHNERFARFILSKF